MLTRPINKVVRPDPIFNAEYDRLLQQPENKQPLSKAQAIAKLRRLALVQPDSESAVSFLAAESAVLHDRIVASDFFRELPYGIQHFLSDADIRFKDSSYQEWQKKGLLDALERWEVEG